MSSGESERRFAAARLWAAAHQPYLGSGLFACTLTSSPGSGAVRIDRRWRVHADPEVVAALEAPQFGRLLLHLVGHVVRGHGERADAVNLAPADRGRWTVSADAELNDDLAAAGLLPPVVDVVPSDLGLSAGGLVESYFAALPATVQGHSCGGGADGSDDGDGTEGISAIEGRLLRLAIAREVSQAALQPGSVPGGWARWAEATIAPTVDWRRVLAAELRRAIRTAAGAVDYSYRRPSRRHVGLALPRPVIPTLHRPVPTVAIVCDTSGSMGERELEEVLAEVDGLLARVGLRSARTPVLAVDTHVQAMRHVSSARQVALAGGGGTDMGAGIAAATRLRPCPDVIVVLTDGWTPWPDRPPDHGRVVAALIGEHAAPVEAVPQWITAVRARPQLRPA